MEDGGILLHRPCRGFRGRMREGGSLRFGLGEVVALIGSHRRFLRPTLEALRLGEW